MTPRRQDAKAETRTAMEAKGKIYSALQAQMARSSPWFDHATLSSAVSTSST